ncbi:MAG: hypothetical protein ACR2NW_09245 [Thermodesulfobacteriota bacterium]
MANALLYYRTPTSTSNIISDPFDLDSDQQLEFIFPDDLLEGLNELYKNNIKQIPVPNQDGARKINIQENGLEINNLSLNGIFKNENGNGISQLKKFRLLKQIDNYHLFGVFGIQIDNAPEFNLDPDNTMGFHISETIIGYIGMKKTRYDFNVKLGFGGTLV